MVAHPMVQERARMFNFTCGMVSSHISGAGQATEHNPCSRVRKPTLKVFNAGITAVIHVPGVDLKGSGTLPIRMQVTQMKYPVVEFGLCIGGS